jgi:hypothetical protein
MSTSEAHSFQRNGRKSETYTNDWRIEWPPQLISIEHEISAVKTLRATSEINYTQCYTVAQEVVLARMFRLYSLGTVRCSNRVQLQKA